MFAINHPFEPLIKNWFIKISLAIRLYQLYGDYRIPSNEIVFIESIKDLEALELLEGYWIECVKRYSFFTEVYLSSDTLLILPNKSEFKHWITQTGGVNAFD